MKKILTAIWQYVNPECADTSALFPVATCRGGEKRRQGAAVRIKKLSAILISFAFIGIVCAQNVVAPKVEPIKPTELFNGTNLDGFIFCMKNDADPAKTWSVENGLLHCNGSAIGYLRTKQAFTNYIVTVEWRFVKVEPKRDNTGVLVNLQAPDKVWPVCVQNQGKSTRQGDLFVMAGAECKEHLALGKDANTPVTFTVASPENPVGQWNTNVTICVGNTVKAVINGKALNQITECTVSNGFVGIQSEGADFEIRKISLQPGN